MELVLILIIVLIIFGAGKIPQLGEGLGKAIKGFKKSVNEADAIDVTPPPSDAPEAPPTQIAQAQDCPAGQCAGAIRGAAQARVQRWADVRGERL